MPGKMGERGRGRRWGEGGGEEEEEEGGGRSRVSTVDQIPFKSIENCVR